ncbi:hypothetical protein GYMLUDRAFT_36979 [Collybiopsis luxurians FD-317 M1]|nr:hypothetical protein GYMLUDRAFT_36979 [Collybiopsis luxurians FD-317 M1]
MPLFRDHPLRSTVCVAIAVVLGHTATSMLNSLYAYHLTQTSVAILGLSGFMLLIAINHRRAEGEGHHLTQMQEEMLLIVGFGLLYIAISLGWRAVTGQGVGIERSGLGRTEDLSRKGSDGRPYPCSEDDIYCIVEEYSYF